MEEIRLQRVDEKKNMRRFYIIRKDWQMPLFGGKTLTLIHGRIGRWSVQKTVCLQDEKVLEAVLSKILKIRAKRFYRSTR
ncbi:MAG TPA: WGR domain-containing protein [Thermotogota bacterium]|nr:WGR domain-containing protein [Thermotogota bacterium]